MYGDDTKGYENVKDEKEKPDPGNMDNDKAAVIPIDFT